MNKFEVLAKSENETIQLAKAVAPYFNLGDVILLDGDLGSGKTQFVKGFTSGLVSSDLVTSPTFTIAQFYKTQSGSILHIDAYRLSGVGEFRDTGLSDYFDQSIVLIEWGSKLMTEFDDYLIVEFAHVSANKDYRTITFSYTGKVYATQFELLSQKLFNL